MMKRFIGIAGLLVVAGIAMAMAQPPAGPGGRPPLIEAPTPTTMAQSRRRNSKMRPQRS